MATRDAAFVKNQLHGARGVTVLWEDLSANDDGIWKQLVLFKFKALHVYGDFNGAVLFLEGTNEDANLITPAHAVHLKDTSLNEISLTSTSIIHVFENPLYVRPVIVGGDGSTDLTVLLVCRP